MVKSKKIYKIPNIINRNILVGHSAPVEDVMFYKDSIISASRDKMIKIWDPLTGENLRTLKGHTGAITSLDVKDNIIISGSRDNTAKMWDFKTGECLATLRGHTGGILSVCISNFYVASASEDSTIRIWNKETRELKFVFKKHTRNVSWVKIVGDILYSASWDHFLRIWDLSQDGKCIEAFEEHSDAINVEFHSKNVIVTGDQTGYIFVWDLKLKEVKFKLKHHKRAIMGLCIYKNYLYSTSMDRTILIWDLNTGVCVKKLEGHGDATIGIDKRKNLIVSSSADNSIRIWDDFSTHSVRILEGHESLILGTVADGNSLVSVGTDNVIKVWNVETGELVKKIDTGIKTWIWGLAFSKGRILISSDQGIYRLYDINTGNMIKSFSGHQGTTYRTTIKGNLAITAGWDNTARVWDLDSGECLHILRGHNYPVYSGAITDDGQFITSSSDGTVRVWDNNGKEIRVIKFHQDEIFHIDVEDDIVVTASGDGICGVFNYKTGDIIATLDDHTDQVWCVQIHEGLVFTGSADNTIKIWDIARKSCIDTLEGHTDNVKDLTISNQYLVSGSMDSSIQIWDLKRYYHKNENLNLSTTPDLEILTAQIQLARTYNMIPSSLGDPGIIRIIYGMDPLDDSSTEKHQKLVLSIKEMAKSWSKLGKIGYAPWLADISAGIKSGIIEIPEEESLETILQKFIGGLRENSDLYWLGLLRRYGNNLESLIPTNWTFRLDFSGQGPNPTEDFEWIHLGSKLNYAELDDREETALIFRMTLSKINEWILPLIKSFEIQIKDDRGDVNYIHFTNFLPNKNNEWSTTAMFKIDQGYKMEPNAILAITDIRIIYNDRLIPNFQGSNILKQLSEIRFENQQLYNKIDVLQEQYIQLSQEISSKTLKEPKKSANKKIIVQNIAKGYQLENLYNIPKSMEIFNFIKTNFHEPRIGIINVRIKEYFNKFLEHIQPKFILFNSATAIATALTSILVFLAAFNINLLGNTINVLGEEISVTQIILFSIIYSILILILIISATAWFKYQFKRRKKLHLEL